MMDGIMRPTRGGRANKVVKQNAIAGTPSRGGRGRSAQVSHLQQHHQQQHSPPDDVGKHSQYDEGAMMNELNVAAAAAAAAAAINVAENAEMGEAEAEADMEDDDQDMHHHQQHHDHTDNMDLNTAANILANGGSVTAGGQLTQGTSADHQQHHMQQAHQPPAAMGGPSPHHLEQHNQNLDPSFVRTTEELARDSGYGQLNVESALAKRLAREPGLRIAQQRRPDQQLNLQRRSNVEALFAHIAGDLAPTACKNCHKGHGPWTSCVVVDGQMCGSCANCWFNASGARCSFHETRQAHHTGAMMNTPSASLQDPNASYVVHSAPAAQPQLTQQALPTTPGHNATLAALGQQSNDPVVRYTIERAMAEVRSADSRTRQIMMIEIAAKQLALQIVDYEDKFGANGQQVIHGHNGQAQNGGHQDGTGNGVAPQ